MKKNDCWWVCNGFVLLVWKFSFVFVLICFELSLCDCCCCYCYSCSLCHSLCFAHFGFPFGVLFLVFDWTATAIAPLVVVLVFVCLFSCRLSVLSVFVLCPFHCLARRCITSRISFYLVGWSVFALFWFQGYAPPAVHTRPPVDKIALRTTSGMARHIPLFVSSYSSLLCCVCACACVIRKVSFFIN